MKVIKEITQLDIRKVKKLIELLEESGIAEIEIKEGEEAVRISRMPTGPVCHARTRRAMAPAPMIAAPAAAPAVAALRGTRSSRAPRQ